MLQANKIKRFKKIKSRTTRLAVSADHVMKSKRSPHAERLRRAGKARP